jgi:hypothetical protein
MDQRKEHNKKFIIYILFTKFYYGDQIKELYALDINKHGR